MTSGKPRFLHAGKAISYWLILARISGLNDSLNSSLVDAGLSASMVTFLKITGLMPFRDRLM